MGIVFAAPMVLTALIGLPVLWVILRALPPKPKTVIFSAVTLLHRHFFGCDLVAGVKGS